MENAAEALKMAFGYILFVLALSISISSFSNATKAVNAIIQLKDKSRKIKRFFQHNHLKLIQFQFNQFFQIERKHLILLLLI